MTPSQRLDATFGAGGPHATRDPRPARPGGRLGCGTGGALRHEPTGDLKHLKVLEHAGLISTAQDAQRRPRKIEGVRLGEATAWLEEYRRFWERRYSALDELLGQLQAKPRKSKRKSH